MTIEANNRSVKAKEISSEEVIKLESEYGCHNYHPLPVVFSKANGIWVWDPEGNKYMDFLSAYSAVNQGHCHPKIIKALVDQASTLHLSARAFYSSVFGPYAKFVSEIFGMEMILPMNTGAEAVESALKLARKWGYSKKNIAPDQAIILGCEGNFHGRTIGIISMSSDPSCRTDFGPFVSGISCVCPSSGMPIRFNNIADIESAFKVHSERIAGFIVEPIQGEAGIFVPDEGYLTNVRSLCSKYNILFIVDEVQTGLCRTGRMLAIDHENVKADILVLGKALSGGVYPVSAVLSSKEIMTCIQPGEHGSTFGGNPLGCAVSMAALNVLKDEKMGENADRLGEIFRRELRNIKSPVVTLVRGTGLLNAVVIDEAQLHGKTAWHVCLVLKRNGLLAKPTHTNIIRLAPPLCITEEEILNGVRIFAKSLVEIETLQIEDIPGHNM
jgi:ornithine--oxo-acid transaminase